MFSSLGVTDPFDSHHRLVSSPLYSSRALAFQRLVLAVYGCSTVITSLVYESVVLRQGNIWFSFFTHLAYIGLTAYFVVSTFNGFKYRPSPSTSYAYPLQRWHKALQASHILLMSTITTFPLLVTICYWALLSSSGTFATRYETWVAVSLHMLNSAFTLLEISTTNIPPLPWMALPVCLVILAGYLGVAYITHADQGVYTYPFLNPETQHSKLAAYIIGIAISQVILFTLVRYTIIFRDRIFKYHEQTDTRRLQQEPVKEALEEWEEVHWNGEFVGMGRESAGTARSNPASSVKESVTESKATDIIP